jgi:hypothetical protein
MEILLLWGFQKWLPTFQDDHPEIAKFCAFPGFPTAAHDLGAAGLPE